MSETEIRNLRTLFKNGENDKIREFMEAFASKKEREASTRVSISRGGGADAAWLQVGR